MSQDLVQSFIRAIATVLEDMDAREQDAYWYGQICASLDIEGIDIWELQKNKQLIKFNREV